MKVSPITRDDLPECAALFVEVFNREPWHESWTIEPVLARFNECFRTPGFSGLIGREGNAICFALGYVETWESSKHFFLKEMCVARDHQRSGVGSELITELEKDLISKGIRKIYLLTARDGSAESFYRKNGFYVSPKMIMMGKHLTSEENEDTTNL
jgi:aminoglycoside 6'-N-acetyltransferase I